jgi:hypothetical protein
MIVKKGIKIIKYVGNEYAQSTCLQVQGGEQVWVGNVYIPPVQNMQKRGTDEEVAHSYIEDILGGIPEDAKSVVCGDWNARIGDMSPTIGDTTIPRQSLDRKTNSRAPWII